MDETAPPPLDSAAHASLAPTVESAPTDGLARRLRGDESRRTRSAGLLVVLISGAITAYFAANSPSPSAGTRFGAAYFGVLAVVSAGLWISNRRGRYGERSSALVGFLVTLGVLGACLWIGPASMATAPLPLLVFYYGLGDSGLRRGVVLATATLGYAALIAAVAAGWLPETGLIAPASRYAVEARGYLYEGLFVEVLLFVTFLLARLSRRSTLVAMEGLERARVRIAAQHALLQEAHANYDRVVLGARLGRLSGRVFDDLALGDVLGRGATAEVYEATDSDGRPVAVKVMHRPQAEVHVLARRLAREAELMRALAGPRIVRVIGSGQAPDGSPYVVMERLTGEDLAATLRERGRLPLDEVTRLIRHVAEGLEVAHASSVVHRDIKPQNLFLVPARGWVILDFGIARVLEPGGTLTEAGGVLGTPAYMAPEQVVSSRVDRRADVFALSAVAYRAATGRPPFSANVPALTMFAVRNQQPVRPGTLADLPESVEQVLALGLAKSPADRLRSADELAEAWVAAVEGRLDPTLARRAEALLARQPWDATVE